MILQDRTTKASRPGRPLSNGLYYLVPPLIVTAILLLVYGVKGIYPFGGLTVVYGDMDQHYIPFSYHIYDVFHHGKSLFWDPFLGTGSNIFGIEALSGMFSPISWLVVFTSRENIPHFASFLLLVRMALLSLTSMVFMNTVFRDTRVYWRVALSVLYGFSGYVLIFYTNMVWIDCAILFPLLLITLKNLFEKDRIIGYLCLLSAHLIVSYYISFMILLFIFFGSGIFLLFYVEKNRRKKVLMNLGFGTIGALLMTSFITVPAFLQSSSSIRFGSFSYLAVIGKDTSESVTLNKALFFFFAATLIVIVIRIFLNWKNNRKMVLIFSLLMAVTVPQVVVESINLLWYGGSYVCYPYRFGFIPIFVLLAGCAYFFSPHFISSKGDSLLRNRNRNIALQATPEDVLAKDIGIIAHPAIRRVVPADFRNRKGMHTLQILAALIALAAYLAAVYLGSKFGSAINRTLYGYWGIPENLSILFMLTALFLAAALWVLLTLPDRKIKYILVSVVLLTEIFTHSMWYIGVPPRSEGHIDDWSVVANGLHKELEPDSDTFSRYKDADSVMNANYPLVMGAQAVSTYMHIIRPAQQDTFKRLGYSINYTRILDTGGTVFSDMVFNVDHVLSLKPYPSELYDMVRQTGGFYVNESRYTLPDGIVYTPERDGAGSVVLPVLSVRASPLDNQNVLYQTLFGKKDRLIEPVDSTPVYTNIKPEQIADRLHCTLSDPGQPGRIEYSILSSGTNVLYLGANSISAAVRIRVNDKVLQVPTLGNPANVMFPSSYNNGILNLGLFTDETVKVEIILSQNTDFNSFSLGTISVEKIKSLSEQFTTSSNTPDAAESNLVIHGNTIRIKAFSNEQGQFLFLPVNNDPGWQCRINGNPAVVDTEFGTFMKISLVQGENDIELRFVPEGFKTGFLLSAATLIAIFAILFLLRRKRAIVEKRGDGMMKWVYILFWTVYFSGVLFVYIIPIISMVIRNVKLLLFR